MIGPDQIDAFEQNGYLAIPNLASAATVELLREAYDALLENAVNAATERKLGGRIRQIMFPSRCNAIFSNNTAVTKGRAIAAKLLRTQNPNALFDMLIYKEPGQLTETPWHQDFAYTEMPFSPAGSQIPTRSIVQFWLALDDVDVENGCMHFIPRQHKAPLLPHYVAGGAPDDPGRLLAIKTPEDHLDLSQAIACPLFSGGATVHEYGTPHFTPGNRSRDRLRRAFIFNFARTSSVHADC